MNKKAAPSSKQKSGRPTLDLESSFGDLSANATTRSEERFTAQGVNRAERASQLVRQHPSAFEGTSVTAPTQIDTGEAVPLFNAASYVVGRNYRVPLALLDFKIDALDDARLAEGLFDATQLQICHVCSP